MLNKGYLFRQTWRTICLALAALVALPVLLIIGALVVDSGGTWQHLVATRLTDYVTNSLMLGLGVMIGSVVLDVSCAWAVTSYQFPGRAILTWALLLPMAMPAYVAAYAYTDVLEFAGPVQTALRNLWGWQRDDYWFPEIRSLGGGTLVMSLVLYPYVYLTTRAALLAQGSTLFESASSLGAGPWRRLFCVALPMARPAIIGGATLVIMEALTD
ncbi:MAG: iron ABC transporter permease, partial [Sphaerospermopsis sp. SIO1G2]|nr:iron ABC transporter permease [Sphaerospermopsis sp. SIO1G2]